VWRWLKRWWDGPEDQDGFGQSLADDLRFWARFRTCRMRPVLWRKPTPQERAGIESHPILTRFGDDTIAVADVDGRRWIVRDRLWFGWPDPPEFAFFALDGDSIWAAVDFNHWPSRWQRP
jgi:hypothetical protein